jgi:hypothetical protein
MKTFWPRLFLFACLCVSSVAFAAINVVATVNPGNVVVEGTNGNVQFTFTNTGAASRIGGAGTATFAQQGPDFSDFVNFGPLNFGGCDPFANNVLGACTLTVPFTTDTPIGNEPEDSGSRRIRGGILLENGQMAFGDAIITVGDPPLPAPAPAAALTIRPDFPLWLRSRSPVPSVPLVSWSGADHCTPVCSSAIHRPGPGSRWSRKPNG